jgi:hypothetical protein
LREILEGFGDSTSLKEVKMWEHEALEDFIMGWINLFA